MKRNVKSTDPRKPILVKMFKEQVPGCTKVTLLTQVAPDRYSAQCSKPDPERARCYITIGVFEVTADLPDPVYERCSCGKHRLLAQDWDASAKSIQRHSAEMQERYGYCLPERLGGCKPPRGDR